jgi:hypothetical protein
MKNNQDSPLVAVIFKGFAILGGVMALWQIGKFFVGTTNENPLVQVAYSNAALTAASVHTAGSLTLWWMGEVIELLGKIAKNGIGTATVKPKPGREELENLIGSPKPKGRQEDDYSSPPKYEL